VSFFVHPQGLCESPSIGDGTRIWAFTHILPGARIGRNCNICDHVFIENDVVLGDRVTVKCGVQLWDGVRLCDDVFVGPNATFTNDKWPRSKRCLQPLKTLVAAGASIGANATILPGIEIGARAMIGAGTVVTAIVPPEAIVVGNPGRIVGHINDTPAAGRSIAASAVLAPALNGLSSGVMLLSLKTVRGAHGSQSVGEFQDQVPFQPRRYALVSNAPGENICAAHAHRACHQFLVCVKGSLTVVTDNGRGRDMIVLDHSDLGLYVPPLVWCARSQHSDDALLLVFASHAYDASDDLRDYGEFLNLVRLYDAEAAECWLPPRRAA